ncbi:MAG: 50S ribosomal protein L19 [Patescibacteria group bacterium]|nr:50S ribosomal protein L19 [Patescibacteria group bacterium]MDE2590422.1 50S ribosomal protein L19 [Patescibacteria group bacterium]
MLQINFVPGDVVRVHQKIQEGDKTRIQVFEGVVLSIRGRGENKTFTVQKMVGDIAVERIWPIASPLVEKVEVKAHSKKRVKRAKLYNLQVARPIVS